MQIFKLNKGHEQQGRFGDLMRLGLANWVKRPILTSMFHLYLNLNMFSYKYFIFLIEALWGKITGREEEAGKEDLKKGEEEEKISMIVFGRSNMPWVHESG